MSKLLINPFPKYSRSPIKKLIDHFNKIPVDDDIQRLFYLQKISQVINKTRFDSTLFEFVNKNPNEAGSWEAMLLSYDINPDASFFLKGIHFAKAISNITPKSEELTENNIYLLMQERDGLLEQADDFAANKERFIKICTRINVLATQQKDHVDLVIKHENILKLTKLKLSAIKQHTKETSTAYKTEPLGTRHVNNYNCKLHVKGLPEALILRIEDRAEMNIEEKLHSHRVAKYFGAEVGVCWVQVINEDTKEIEYKPLALSQYANRGDLRNVAKELRNADSARIVSTTKHFFFRLNDFCLGLKNAGAYHPDIKLSNFLVHNQSLLVSDRKTFIDEANPAACNIRSTPHYAPPQYADCLNEDCDGYLPKARTTRFNMDQFMAYQVGMALKEFLILTQLDELPDEYWEPDCNIAGYFKNPTHQITNLALIVGEMTRIEEGNRLSIKDFQSLMFSLVQQPDEFVRQLEGKLPAAQLKIDTEIDAIKKLLADTTLKGTELLKQANPIFTALLDREIPDSRLHWYAEKLATKTLQVGSGKYFTQLALRIEHALLESDWDKAPWYRKVAHVLTFGYFRVARLTKVSEININLDFQDPEFQIHVPQLSIMKPSALDCFSKNLTEFLRAHINEIIPQTVSQPGSASGTVDPKSTPDSPTPGSMPPLGTEDDTNPDSSIPSGSVVIKEGTTTGEKLPFGDVDFKDDAVPDTGSVDFKDDTVPDSGSVVINEEAEPGEKSPLDGIVFEDSTKAQSKNDDAQTTQSSPEEEDEYSSLIIKDDAKDSVKPEESKISRSSSAHAFFSSAKKDIPQPEGVKIEIKKRPVINRLSLHRADSLLRKGELHGIFSTPKLVSLPEEHPIPNPGPAQQ